MKGTLIHYYAFCKRRCYLHANNLTAEDNSEYVKIGKFFHEERSRQKNLQKDLLEVEVDNVKIDQISDDYVVEYKKKGTDVNACRWQLLYYLYLLEKKGVKKKGKLVFKETKKSIEIVLDKDSKLKLENIICKIEKIVSSDKIPPVINQKKCKKCAYFEFCYI